MALGILYKDFHMRLFYLLQGDYEPEKSSRGLRPSAVGSFFAGPRPPLLVLPLGGTFLDTWGFPKIRGTLLGFPIIRIIVFAGLS